MAEVRRDRHHGECWQRTGNQPWLAAWPKLDECDQRFDENDRAARGEALVGRFSSLRGGVGTGCCALLSGLESVRHVHERAVAGGPHVGVRPSAFLAFEWSRW